MTLTVRGMAPVALVALLVLLAWPAPPRATPLSQIVIAQGVDPTTLDPHAHDGGPTYNVLLNVYDTLLFRDRDLRLTPALAESWRMIDPTTWEFRLRPGVKFHNGEECDADAVKWSLDRLRDPALKNLQAGYFRLVSAV